MRVILLLVVCMFFALHVCGQENIAQDKITLNTGEVYVGKIVVKTSDMIMLATKEGMRFQFQLLEIAKIESEISLQNNETEKTTDKILVLKSDFGGLVELTAGVSSAKYSFGWLPNTQLSLLFGAKNSFDGRLFLGAGVGYSSTFLTYKSSSVAFLPLFVRLQTSHTKKRTTPFVGMDTGYAFALNSGYAGGVLVKISLGIMHRISYKTSLIVGAYSGVQSFSGELIETNELGTFSYYGKTTMNNVGMKVGLVF